MSTKQYLKGKKKSIAGFAALTFALSMSLSGTSVNAATSGPHAGGTMYYIQRSCIEKERLAGSRPFSITYILMKSVTTSVLLDVHLREEQ